jgi:hypothetical protein
MANNYIEQIFDDYRMIALIVYSEHKGEGVEFFTPNNFSQQLASIIHNKGHKIQPHIHKAVPRSVKYTQETLFIKDGKVKINFYSEEKKYLDSRTLKTGDVILLVSGGHEFIMLEKTHMFEVKQGPYAGVDDKERFDGVMDDSC